MRTFIVFISVALWVGAGYLIINKIFSLPMVSDNYSEHVDAKLELEKKNILALENMKLNQLNTRVMKIYLKTINYGIRLL